MKTASSKVTAERLVRDALEKAKHFSDYHIFTFLNEEGALKKACEIDAKIARGEKVGRLAGVPYALKDNFLSPEGETTASAHILEGFTSPITATAIQKIEDEGAIMIGRTNLDAFAHGSSTENSYFGPTHNAFDFERVAGGSSGGSAVAVALDIVEFATGTDTGGSIRQPASFNGVYGLKPTYGAISRYGVVAMASSTDCVGFFTKSPEDMDLLMSITAGQDPKDMTTLPNYYRISDSIKVSKRASSASIRVGVIKEFDNESVDPEIRKALARKVELLNQDLGFTAEEELIAKPILKEIRERVQFMKDVGLGYLELGRAANTLIQHLYMKDLRRPPAKLSSRGTREIRITLRQS